MQLHKRLNPPHTSDDATWNSHGIRFGRLRSVMVVNRRGEKTRVPVIPDVKGITRSLRAGPSPSFDIGFCDLVWYIRRIRAKAVSLSRLFNQPVSIVSRFRGLLPASRIRTKEIASRTSRFAGAQALGENTALLYQTTHTSKGSRIREAQMVGVIVR